MKLLKLILFFHGLAVLPTYPASAQQNANLQDSTNLVSQGNQLFEQADFYQLSPDSNIAIIKSAIPFFEEAKNWKSVINCYNNLSGYFYDKNDFDHAEQMARIAQDLSESKGLTASKNYLDALSNLAVFLDIRGFREEAILEYQKIIANDKKLNTPKIDLATSYQNMASAYKEIGDYDEAIEALNNVLRIRKSLSAKTMISPNTNQADIAGSYFELADCYQRKKDNSQAIQFFNKSIESLSTLKDDNKYHNQIRYNCFYKLSEIYLTQNQTKKAEFYVLKAISIKEKNKVYDACFSYLILAKLNLRAAKKNEALLFFDQAIAAAQAEADGFVHYPKLTTCYLEKGKALIELSAFDQALVVFQKGLQITSLDFKEKDYRINPSLDQIIQKLNALDLIRGKAIAFTKKHEKEKSDEESLKSAYDHYLLALQLIQAIRQSYNTDAAKFILAEKSSIIYEEAIAVCFSIYQQTGTLKYLQQAFLFAESNKGMSLLEAKNETAAIRLAGLPDTTIKLERSLSIKLKYEEKELAKAIGAKDAKAQDRIQAIETKRFALKEAYKNLIAKTEKEFPKYYQLKHSNATQSVESIQQQFLDDKTALIEYFVGTKNIYCFVITKQTIQLNEIKKSAAFTAQIKTLKQTLSTPPKSKSFVAEFEKFTKNSFGLYQLILQEPLQSISTQIKNLILIPDGVIGLIPFEVLLTKAAKPDNINFQLDHLSYLFERFSISYSYSATLRTSKPQQELNLNRKVDFIAFAPSFEHEDSSVKQTRARSELYNLKCSSKETQNLNTYFAGKVITGKKATKLTFIEQVSKYPILHLATHAFLNEDNPMLHEIHFSDGYLTPFDIYNLKLKAQLVVLSACNTGTGKIVLGEGLMSLARSFIQSGASSTLMSLWAVDDCATSEIMTSFYQELHSGRPKHIALQNAKLDYIQNASDQAKAHPFYWSAFVQIGDSNPLTFETERNPPYFIFVGITFFLIFFYWQKNKQKK
ncbi:MAG: CHAT domain-containing protein [Saprospiraceae bacterium]